MKEQPRSIEDDAGPVLAPRVGQVLLIASILLTVGSIVTVLLVLPDGTPTSSDPGSPAVPIWATILPPTVGIVMMLLLPWRPMPMRAVPVERKRLLVTTGALLVFFAAFTLAVPLVPLQEEDYVLGKFILLMVLPAALVLLVRHSVRFQARAGAWRWWAPLLVVAVWFYLSKLAPWNPRADYADIDPTFVIIGATATAITAGIGEELFFRRWLQTRMEAALGAWAGIGVTAVLFALMHLGSHGTGDVLVDIARVIAIQAPFGWFLGVMWWRYRNLTLIILTHLIMNGWGVVAYFIAQG